MMISLFDRVENTVEKGENACYQHFLLSQSVFKGHLSQGCYSFPKQALVFTCQLYKSFGKCWEKEKLLITFLSNLKLLSANTFCLEASKIYHLGKGENLAMCGNGLKVN